MNTIDYAHIVGLFREQEQADEAVTALQQVGIAKDQITLNQYQPEQPQDGRVLVHVVASGREQEAVDILVHCGANNADIPLGTALVNDNLVQYSPEEEL